jgi:uncharacterized protein
MNRSMVMKQATRSGWKEPMVWLVLAGPLAVVIAGFVTLWIAFDGADEPLKTQAVPASGQPAVAARNHAAANPPAR